jgi:hypothetical protein
LLPWRLIDCICLDPPQSRPSLATLLLLRPRPTLGWSDLARSCAKVQPQNKRVHLPRLHSWWQELCRNLACQDLEHTQCADGRAV